MKDQTRQEISHLLDGAPDIWKSLIPVSGSGDIPTVDEPYRCEKCHDSGWIRFSRDGYDFVQECDCVKVNRARKRIEKSGLKHLINSYTFDAFVVEEPWQQRILDKAKLYVDTLLSGESDPAPWFFIGGNAGAGKTHICTAICSALLNAGKRVMYMQWVTDARAIKAAVTEQSEYDDLIDPLINCDVLYIDDLFKTRGSTLPTPTESDVRLAYQIINARYASGKPTIISCEWYLREELVDIDEATFSRVVQRCRKSFNVSLKRDKSRNWRLTH